MNFDPILDLYDYQVFGEFGGVNPSIEDSATFTFLKAETMTQTFHGESKGCFLYSRHWNPTTKNLATALSKIEGTEDAWITASGMSAISISLLHLCNSGDHIISSRTTYGGTYALLKNYLPKFNIEVTFVDITKHEEVEKAIRPNTKVIYTETMTNPLLEISNIPKLADIANKCNAKLVVDNTFTPLIFSPSRLGAHVTIHSLTKFINGTNDTIGGAICSTSEFINSLIDVNNGSAMLLGPTMDSLRAASILKNMHTLHLRMRQHSKNAMYLATHLQEVGIKVVYPGFDNHPQHNLMKELMNSDYGYGGMFTINLKTLKTATAAMEAMQNENVGYLAVSLGYFKTLFSSPGSSTSSEIPHDEQVVMGLTDGLIRFSVGLDSNIEHTFERIKGCLQKVGVI